MRVSVYWRVRGSINFGCPSLPESGNFRLRCIEQVLVVSSTRWSAVLTPQNQPTPPHRLPSDYSSLATFKNAFDYSLFVSIPRLRPPPPQDKTLSCVGKTQSFPLPFLHDMFLECRGELSLQYEQQSLTLGETRFLGAGLSLAISASLSICRTRLSVPLCLRVRVYVDSAVIRNHSSVG